MKSRRNSFLPLLRLKKINNKEESDSLSILDAYFSDNTDEIKENEKKNKRAKEKMEEKESEAKLKKAQSKVKRDDNILAFGEESKTIQKEVETFDGLIRAEVRISRTLFPKTVSEMQDSDYKIIACELVNLIEGEAPKLNNFGNFVVKGLCPFYQIGEEITVVLEEQWNEKFQNLDYTIVHAFKNVPLNSETDQKKYLEYILTDSQIKKLYEYKGNIFDLIKEERVDELVKIKGIGISTAEKMIARYKETIDNSQLYIALFEYDLTPKMMEKLLDKYKSPELIIKKIQTNPYILATEVDGIGFKKADEIARSSKIDYKGVFRMEGFILCLLKEYGEDGHMWIPPSELFGIMLDTLQLERDEEVDANIKKAMNNLYEGKKIWYNEEKTQVALMYHYWIEKEVAEHLARIQNSDREFLYGDTEKILKEKEFIQGWEYTDEQREAMRLIQDNQILMVTGKAGTGKSTVVDGILAVLNSGGRHYSFAQTALSGRASARLAEVTGNEGHTIHRLLGYNPAEGWKYNEENRLSYDIIIVDEVSMIGVDLFHKLVRAICSGSKLIMLGDVAQLEAIGLGNLAVDMIDSGAIPLIQLTKIHRQAQKSSIVTDSIKVSEGKKITRQGWTGQEVRGELQDLELNIYSDKEESQGKVVKYFKEHLALVKNVMEVQVLTPTKSRGSICTKELNPLLQNIYNPDDGRKDYVVVEVDNKKENNYIIREGDKVINKKNQYKAFSTSMAVTPIFNGDLGLVKKIQGKGKDMQVIVEFERVGDIILTPSLLKNIELAYAITIHSFQGSQADHTICVLDYSAYTLLTRQMLYTILTRAKKYCVLVAEGHALNHAIDTSHVPFKRTFLKEFLQQRLDKVT